MLREELRPVTFRLILAEPANFPVTRDRPMACTACVSRRPGPSTLEARRLSPAANFYRSLIGVCLDEKKEMPRIWGILHSGLRWLQNVHGGRGRPQTLPPALVLSVTGPGRVTFGFGSEVLARAESGLLIKQTLNVFESQWMRDTFEPVRNNLFEGHARARKKLGPNWPPLDPMLVRVISQHAIKRLISALRSAHHGATILLLPMDMSDELGDINRFIDLKYRFDEGEPRRRFPTLVARIMNRVAELNTGKTEPVGWTEYALSNDEIADRAGRGDFRDGLPRGGLRGDRRRGGVDAEFRADGFGGEISGELPGVVTVRRALDLEGDEGEEEFTESVGTRHRSAYRLSSGDAGGGRHRDLAGRRRAFRQEPQRRRDVLGPGFDDLAGRVARAGPRFAPASFCLVGRLTCPLLIGAQAGLQGVVGVLFFRARGSSASATVPCWPSTCPCATSGAPRRIPCRGQPVRPGSPPVLNPASAGTPTRRRGRGSSRRRPW